MGGTYRLALTGDVIMNSRVSACRDADVLAAVEVLRGADVTHAHLEIPLHDFGGAGIFGAAEGALAWYRGPRYIAGELRWMGVDVVSTASNHSLDYSYGGLWSTIEALDAAGLPHAGTGGDLAAARAPAFTDTAAGRVALVSATSSFPAFARAGAARTDAPGRPGVNPLRYVHVIDPGTARQVASLAAALGLWAVRDGDEIVVHPPGLHNSIRRFRVAGDEATGGEDRAREATGGTRATTACDDSDLAGNMESIRYARSVADLVIAHLHVQEWDGADGRMLSTPAFAGEFARAAVAAGAGVVLIQGAHAPMRGIEVLEGVPVFYEPGPLFRLGRREAQPHDFYTRWGNAPQVRSFDAGILDAYAERDTALGGDVAGSGGGKQVLSPREGNAHHPGSFVPVCEVDQGTHRVTRVALYPMSWSRARRATTGFPVRLTGERASQVLARVAELSAPYATAVSADGDTGWVAV
jgi:hypothetical protein